MTAATERWIASALAVVALASVGWFGPQLAKSRAALGRPVKAPVSARTQDPCPELVAWPENPVWGAPPSAVRGEEWTFDLFSPPELLLDRDTGVCFVRGDDPEESPTAQPERAGPFVLRGYLGAGATVQIVLEATATRQWVTTRVGEWIGDSGWRVVQFEPVSEAKGGFSVTLADRDARRIQLAALAEPNGPSTEP